MGQTDIQTIQKLKTVWKIPYKLTFITLQDHILIFQQ